MCCVFYRNILTKDIFGLLHGARIFRISFWYGKQDQAYTFEIEYSATMAKSKLIEIWILKSEELDDEMRLKKSQNLDIIVNNKEREVLNWEETSSKNGDPHIDKENHEEENICNTCNFTTKYPKSLRHHKRKGCKKYKCNQCTDPKAFTKEELKKHKISTFSLNPEMFL